MASTSTGRPRGRPRKTPVAPEDNRDIVKRKSKLPSSWRTFFTLFSLYHFSFFIEGDKIELPEFVAPANRVDIQTPSKRCRIEALPKVREITPSGTPRITFPSGDSDRTSSGVLSHPTRLRDTNVSPAFYEDDRS